MPAVPYLPASPSHLAVYIPTNDSATDNNDGSPDAGLEVPGEFGSGPNSAYNEFWFNISSASFGCKDISPTVECAINVIGYVWNGTEQVKGPSYASLIQSCPTGANCTMQALDLGNQFVGLSGLQIQAFVNAVEVPFYLDDVEMGWYNDSCAAGLERLKTLG